MLCKRHAELRLHVWQRYRQRLRQLLTTGWSTKKTLCPARPRLSSSPAQRTIVSSAVSTTLRSWFVLPHRTDVAVVVKRDRPFSPQVRNANDCQYCTRTSIAGPPASLTLSLPSSVLNTICFLFAWQLKFFFCVPSGSSYANLFCLVQPHLPALCSRMSPGRLFSAHPASSVFCTR